MPANRSLIIWPARTSARARSGCPVPGPVQEWDEVRFVTCGAAAVVSRVFAVTVRSL